MLTCYLVFICSMVGLLIGLAFPADAVAGSPKGR